MSTKYLTITETADMLGVSTETVRNYVKRGVLAVDKKPGISRSRVRRDSVMAFLDDGYNVIQQVKEIAALRDEVAKQRNELKLAKENLAVQKEAMRIKGIVYENLNEIRDILCVTLDALGDGILPRRENEVLEMFMTGHNYEAISEKFDLTRERIRQIYHKALRRLSRARDYASYKSECEVAKNEAEELRCKIQNLQLALQANKIPDPNEAILIPNTLIGLDNFPLTIRSYHCLKAIGINNLYELVAYNRWELARVRNFGRKSLDEIDDIMSAHGIVWGNVDSLRAPLNPCGAALEQITVATINNLKNRKR